MHDAHTGEYPGARGWEDFIIGKIYPLLYIGSISWVCPAEGLICNIISNGIALKQTNSIVTLEGWNLSKWEFLEEIGLLVRLTKLEIWWSRDNFYLGPTVLG
jgi:hypothetical protein